LDSPERQRGVLRIFYADSPHIGVILRMLRAARSARRRGIDIVIGPFSLPAGPQPQIRRALGLRSEFECLPTQALDARRAGADFDNFDLAAALRREPSIIATGKLLKANRDGMADAALDRWYQAIETLLAAGIDIWAALPCSAPGRAAAT
jgi:two-component system sensor histidine kinase KdpD